ncbi:hypothetical protein CO046_04625 [Candidatus Peregrinibacteria bacterium CG_4_9_14_0_2_um_filter_53_11]|nr:MAG: hypothetical protein CO046_04625 [Candidatus Peregrinibacteria bacterium CG_4_9_14_0_2_um_filter_53_11]
MDTLLQEILSELLEALGISFRHIAVAIDESEGPRRAPLYKIDIETDESAILIGHHGENVYALQHVLKTIVWRKTNESIFVVIDVDGYRRRQEESIMELARRKAEMVRKNGGSQILPPMSPYFRRIVHLTLTADEYGDLTTESVGEGENRAVSIKKS